MNTKNFVIIGIIIVLIAAIAGIIFLQSSNSNDEPAAVKDVVLKFGAKLKEVTLLVTQEQLKLTIQREYASFVTPELLSSWLQDTTKAPGRLTSSPWPDRIEISSIEKKGNAYEVRGNIIEITSVEASNGEVANKLAITATLEKHNNVWLIASFTQESPPTNVFRQDGVIIKNNPGLKPNTWYLSYEMPGSPGLTKELDVGNVATFNVKKGMRVHVEGFENNSIVTVAVLTIKSPYQDDLIWVENPIANQAVSSPLTITGQARGNWYFEASFPVKLLDANGKVLVQKPAQAQGAWMTTEYVPFSVTLDFPKPTTQTGTLVLKKDNPSGLPQNDNELRIPVVFSTAQEQTVKLYYYNPNKDKDTSGNILCSSQGLVAVNRQIPITQTPIQDTINLLLQGQLTQIEKSQGVTTEYPLAGFYLKGANLSNGILTLEFADPQNKTGGGSCRVNILWKQIEATAKQFSGVNQVTFTPEFLFQP